MEFQPATPVATMAARGSSNTSHSCTIVAHFHIVKSAGTTVCNAITIGARWPRLSLAHYSEFSAMWHASGSACAGVLARWLATGEAKHGKVKERLVGMPGLHDMGAPRCNSSTHIQIGVLDNWCAVPFEPRGGWFLESESCESLDGFVTGIRALRASAASATSPLRGCQILSTLLLRDPLMHLACVPTSPTCVTVCIPVPGPFAHV